MNARCTPARRVGWWATFLTVAITCQAWGDGAATTRVVAPPLVADEAAQHALDAIIRSRTLAARHRAIAAFLDIVPVEVGDRALGREAERFVLEQWVCWLLRYTEAHPIETEENGWTPIIAYQMIKADFDIDSASQLTVFVPQLQVSQPRAQAFLGSLVGELIYANRSAEGNQVHRYLDGLEPSELDAVPERFWIAAFRASPSRAFFDLVRINERRDAAPTTQRQAPPTTQRSDESRMSDQVRLIEWLASKPQIAQRPWESQFSDQERADARVAVRALMSSHQWHARMYVAAIACRAAQAEWDPYARVTHADELLAELLKDTDPRVRSLAKVGIAQRAAAKRRRER